MCDTDLEILEFQEYRIPDSCHSIFPEFLISKILNFCQFPEIKNFENPEI